LSRGGETRTHELHARGIFENKAESVMNKNRNAKNTRGYLYSNQEPLVKAYRVLHFVSNSLILESAS
jgi:hypothetical protein